MNKISLSVIASCLMLTLASNAQSESLAEVYQAAQKSDPTLAAAEADYQAQLQNKPIARSVLLPQLNASAGLQRLDQQYSDMANPLFSDANFNRKNWGLKLTQALYRKDYWAQLAQTDAGIAQAQAQIETARQALIVRAAQAYFEVLTAKDSVAFAQAEKEAVQQQFDQAQERFEVGLIAVTDVRESRAQLDISIAAEIAAKAQLDTARENLTAIIGYQPEELTPLSADIRMAPPEPADIDAWVEQSRQNNLQIRAARYGVEAAKQGIELSKSGHYPMLDLVGQYGIQTDTGGFNEGDIDQRIIGVDLVLPLYSGGGTSARVKQSESRMIQAEKGLELAERSAVQQTRASYLNVLSSISQVQALAEVLKSTQTAVEAAEAGFDVGTRTSVDVLDALRQVYRSRRDYTQARHAYILSALRLKQAAGTLDEQDLAIVDAIASPQP